MLQNIEKIRTHNAELNRQYHSYVDVPELMLTIGKEIGCEPPDHKQLLKPGCSLEEVEFGIAMEYGPLAAARFRLRGPNCWDGAKEYIVRNAKSVLGDHFKKLVRQYLTN